MTIKCFRRATWLQCKMAAEVVGAESPLMGAKVVEGGGGKEKVKMKKQLGLVEGVAIILCIISWINFNLMDIQFYLDQRINE